MLKRQPSVLFPNTYVWLVFVSCLDIMLTWVVLWRGGYEVNVLASAVIDQFGLKGVVAFKLSLVVFLVVICEAIGRRNVETAHTLAKVAIGVSAMPVLLALLMLR
jgi:hypothetical protein